MQYNIKISKINKAPPRQTSKPLPKLAGKIKQVVTPSLARYILFFISALALQFAIWYHIYPFQYVGYDNIAYLHIVYGVNLIALTFLFSVFSPYIQHSNILKILAQRAKFLLSALAFPIYMLLLINGNQILAAIDNTAMRFGLSNYYLLNRSQKN